VGDGVWGGVFDADAGDAHVACFAGFAEGVVAAVEVFALLTLELVLEQVLLVGELAVHAEQTLLVG